MRITFEFSPPDRSVGVKESLRYQTETTETPTDIATKLEDLVEASRLLEPVPPADTAQSQGAHPGLLRDATEYELIIQSSGAQRAFSWNDTTVPAPVWPLVRYLKQLAIERRIENG